MKIILTKNQFVKKMIMNISIRKKQQKLSLQTSVQSNH